MSRPALSASRSFEIIELFASFPERRFTFSEIVKATKINIASCHAILSVMTEKGYLIRSTTSRAYQLGPSLVAAGKVAEQGLPLVRRAELATHRLREELGCAVMLCTIVGDEMLAVLSLEDAAGNDTGLRGGERLPLIAPLGVPFLAWASEERIEEWLNRRTIPLDPELRIQLDQTLDETRRRGYHVILRSGMPRTIGAMMGEMAQSRSLENHKEKLSDMLYAFDSSLSRQIEFVGDELYDVNFITAPLFDQVGNAAYNLGIGGFTQPLSGEAVLSHAEHLTRYCLAIMRGDRSGVQIKAG